MTGSCFHLEFDVKFTVEEPTLELAKVRVTVPRESRAELSHLVSRFVGVYSHSRVDPKVAMAHILTSLRTLPHT